MALREYEIDLNGMPATVQLDEDGAKAYGLIPDEEQTAAPKTGRKPRTARKAPKAKAERSSVSGADDPGASE